MSKVIKYNLTFLGTIELADEDENLTDAQIISLITEDAYDNDGYVKMNDVMKIASGN